MRYLVLLALVVALSGCGDSGFYGGAMADAWYHTSWDPDRATEAVEAMGGVVDPMRLEPDAGSLFLGHASLNGTLLTFLQQQGGESWTLRVIYATPNRDLPPMTQDEALTQSLLDREVWEPEMEALVAGFDAASGWEHDRIQWSLRFGGS